MKKIFPVIIGVAIFVIFYIVICQLGLLETIENFFNNAFTTNCWTVRGFIPAYLLFPSGVLSYILLGHVD